MTVRQSKKRLQVRQLRPQGSKEDGRRTETFPSHILYTCSLEALQKRLLTAMRPSWYVRLAGARLPCHALRRGRPADVDVACEEELAGIEGHCVLSSALLAARCQPAKVAMLRVRHKRRFPESYTPL